MPETTLAELLERNARHADSLSDGYFDPVETAQQPAVVSVCCSDSRVSQEGMWSVDEPGWLFTVGNIGNQVQTHRNGEQILSGDVLYPIRETKTGVACVVGHTGCGAITAALEAQMDETKSYPPGIRDRIDSLLPIIEAGLDDERIDADRDVSLVNQFVEYNVDQQVAYLRSDPDVPDTETVLGFVYDFQGVYGEARGRCYLVNYDGTTSVEALRKQVPEEYDSHVRRLSEF